MSQQFQVPETCPSLNFNQPSTNELIEIIATPPERDDSSINAFLTYNEVDQKIETLNQLTKAIGQFRAVANSNNHAVCVVENPSSECENTFISKFEVKPGFFAQHRRNPLNNFDALWRRRIFRNGQYASDCQQQRDIQGENDEGAQVEEVRGPKESGFIDGNWQYPGIELNEKERSDARIVSGRYCFRKRYYNTYPEYSNTRISYYRVDEYLYLFLVDAPLQVVQERYKHSLRRDRPTLRLPYAINWGGLLLPQLLGKDGIDYFQSSLFDSLCEVFRYRWQRDRLFEQDQETTEAFPAPPLCYLLSNSVSTTNLRHLTEKANEVSFQKVRKPRTEIIKELHDLREDVVKNLKSSLAETSRNVPDSIKIFWETVQKDSHIRQDGTDDNPATRHKNMLEDAKELEKYLMDTFQILMSSMSHQQSSRVNQLTTLAFIFIPLSFLTGVFGMNLKIINDSTPPMWVFFIGVAIMIVTVAPAFAFFKWREHVSRKRRSDRDPEHVKPK